VDITPLTSSDRTNARKPWSSSITVSRYAYEIIRASAHVKIAAADLVSKYRKNVQYNLDATRGTSAVADTEEAGDV